MSVTAVNHFTILTDKLPETLAFYEEHLNLKAGARPPFTFPGAWLYADGGRGKDAIQVAAEKAGGTVTAIGEVVARGSDPSRIELLSRDGRRRTVPFGAYDHFGVG